MCLRLHRVSQSLHTLDLSETEVTDVSALASSQSLSVLSGVEAMVGGAALLQMIQDRRRKFSRG
jgi:hypothetical protein